MTINYNYALSKKLNSLLLDLNFTLSFAETFTGGAVCQNFSAVSDSSDVLDCAFVCNTSESLVSLLNVPYDVAQSDGGLSEACAIAMAQGALQLSQSSLALSSTGLAGPDGGTATVPVGRVWIAVANSTSVQTLNLDLNGGRKNIRRKTIQHAFMFLIKCLQSQHSPLTQSLLTDNA